MRKLAFALIAGLIGSGPAIAQTDNTFASQALKSGKDEVALSQLAVQKSQNPKVKQLAEMLVTDHTAVNAKLANIAAKGQPDRRPTSPGTGPNRTDSPPSAAPGAAPESPEVAKLRSLTGANFDQAWLMAIIDGHKKSIALYEREAANSANPDSKALAAETLPKIKHHLQTAEALKSQGK
jgi:putative membrane protein